jgi:hypothetical protein
MNNMVSVDCSDRRGIVLRDVSNKDLRSGHRPACRTGAADLQGQEITAAGRDRKRPGKAGAITGPSKQRPKPMPQDADGPLSGLYDID